MNRQNKILLGILSFIPIFTSGISFILALRLIYLGFAQNIILEEYGNGVIEHMFEGYFWIFLCVLFTSLFGLALMLVFIIFAIKDKSASENDKLLWVLVLLFFNLIALPLYWYFRLWRNDNFGFEQKFTERTN